MSAVERTFIFADLSGYTALTEAHGDGDAATVALRFAELAERCLEPGASLVKTIGDAVMLVTQDPCQGVRIALALRAAVAQEPSFPSLRTGLHHGTAVERRGGLLRRGGEHGRPCGSSRGSMGDRVHA